MELLQLVDQVTQNMLFLGCLRSAAQMFSHEVSIGLILINILVCAGSLNFTQIVLAQQSI